MIPVLVSRLPVDRHESGTLAVIDQETGTVLWGPVPCLAKADNQGASDHGNPLRDPTLPYGDHPLGEYRITGWAPTGETTRSRREFGPGKLVLDPISGPALDAKQYGRYGLLIHGGARAGPYALGFRPTYGCLRITDEDAASLVEFWRSHPEVTCYRAEKEV